MKKIQWILFLLLSLINSKKSLYEENFLEKAIEWGPYKPNFLYSWSKNSEEPITFGFFYSNLKEIPDSFKKRYESFKDIHEMRDSLLENHEVLSNNHENFRFFSKSPFVKIRELVNDGIGTHEKLIKDNELEIEFSTKAIKKLNELSIYSRMEGKPNKLEYLSLFFSFTPRMIL